jgi:hypothetical protein
MGVKPDGFCVDPVCGTGATGVLLTQPGGVEGVVTLLEAGLDASGGVSDFVLWHKGQDSHPVSIIPVKNKPAKVIPGILPIRFPLPHIAMCRRAGAGSFLAPAA